MKSNSTVENLKMIFKEDKIINFILNYDKEFFYKNNMFKYEPTLIVQQKRDINFIKNNFLLHEKDMSFKLTFPKYLNSKLKSQRCPIFFDVKLLATVFNNLILKLEQLEQKENK